VRMIALILVVIYHLAVLGIVGEQQERLPREFAWVVKLQYN
jgi:hypothetical protein